jgi:hypothetical protein
MIDAFAIVLTHSLMLIALWRLRGRDDLDDEAPPAARHRGLGLAAPTDTSPGWRGGVG